MKFKAGPVSLYRILLYAFYKDVQKLKIQTTSMSIGSALHYTYTVQNGRE